MPAELTHTVTIRPQCAEVFEPGWLEPRIGKMGWLGKDAPWPVGTCTAVSYAEDMRSAELTFTRHPDSDDWPVQR